MLLIYIGWLDLFDMNGRMYDYNLGRFMSVDPLIQSPTSTQSVNPYSYIMNNPLAGTDPTGYAAQCSDDNNCDLSSIDVKDVTSIQVTKDGNAIINTNNGSFQVNSIGGKNVQGSFSASNIGDLSSVASKPSYGNDANFVKGYADQANKQDMSGVLSMTPVGQAVDSIKSGIEGIEKFADEYNETGSYTDAALAGAVFALEKYGERKLKLSRAPDVVSDAAKKVPNPWGRRGSPAHTDKVLEAEKRLGDKGWKTISGGSLPEEKVGNRYPDLVMKKGDDQIAVQVGRGTRGGIPVIRERRAMDDLRKTGEFSHVFFVRYDN